MDNLINYDTIKGFMEHAIQRWQAYCFGDETVRFFDLVVLTASNEHQKEAFEACLAAKVKQGDLPERLSTIVFADPPGPKLGSGGSTLHVLAELDKLYGERLKTRRVLILHCGGLSQRLPTCSVLGKVFAPFPLPLASFQFQMFDLKCANFLPFCERMAPGVFVGSSDDLQVYSLSTTSSWSFDAAGFTVLAHPSSLEIGTTHGVYVLKAGADEVGADVAMRACKQVLQKPSVDKMRSCGAINSTDGFEWCYSDSVFFFTHDITQRLVQFHSSIAPISSEICAWGDFLQCLGEESDSSYVTSTATVANADPKLAETRAGVYQLLHKEPITCLVLNNSAYIHFGTMREYLDNYTTASLLRRSIALSPVCSSSVAEPGKDNCFMKSKLSPGVKFGARNIFEYCNLGVPLEFSNDSIVSCCEALPNDWLSFDAWPLPSRLLLHTIPLGADSFATIAFSVDDDLKRKAATAKGLIYFGKNLNMPIDTSAVATGVQGGDTTVSLWTMPLFPAASNRTESLLATLALLRRRLDTTGASQTTGDATPPSLLSMCEILQRSSPGVLVRGLIQLGGS